MPRARPDALVTAAMIARQYYIDGMSKQRIADLHGISRHKVARILRQARESGLVTIEVGGTTQARDIVDGGPGDG